MEIVKRKLSLQNLELLMMSFLGYAFTPRNRKGQTVI